MKLEKYSKYFSNFSCIRRNDLEYNLYTDTEQSMGYLIKNKTNEKAYHEENKFFFDYFMKNISKHTLTKIGEIEKLNLKNMLIKAISIVSFNAKIPEINKDIINMNIQDKILNFEILDDISMMCIRESFKNINRNKKNISVGLNHNSITIALKILKEKKENNLVEIFYNDNFLVFLWDNQLLALRCFETNKDINDIKRIIKETLFSKKTSIEFPNAEALKGKFVDLNKFKINTKIIKELKNTNKKYFIYNSDNSIYRIRDEGNCTNIFVLYPLDINNM